MDKGGYRGRGIFKASISTAGAAKEEGSRGWGRRGKRRMPVKGGGERGYGREGKEAEAYRREGSSSGDGRVGAEEKITIEVGFPLPHEFLTRLLTCMNGFFFIKRTYMCTISFIIRIYAVKSVVQRCGIQAHFTAEQITEASVTTITKVILLSLLTFSSRNGVLTGKQDQKCLNSSPTATYKCFSSH